MKPSFPLIILGVLLFLVVGCHEPKDDMTDPKTRAERGKKIGFTIPNSAQWIESVYWQGIDDGWMCKFTIPAGDVDVMFPPSSVSWVTHENPLLTDEGSYKWFSTKDIKVFRAFEKNTTTPNKTVLRVLVDESGLGEDSDASQEVTVYLFWFEI